MRRFSCVLCCAASLAAVGFDGSPAHGERIRIAGVIADYDSIEDVVDVEIWLTRPMDMQSERLSFVGRDFAMWATNRGIEFQVSNGTTATPEPGFSLVTRRATPHPLGIVWTERTDVGMISHVERDAIREGEMRHVVSFTFNADDLRFDELESFPTFRYSASMYDGDYAYAEGVSTVDAPRNNATAPEPSSVALAAIGIMLVAVHLWTPRSRQRGGKRCSA